MLLATQDGRQAAVIARSGAIEVVLEVMRKLLRVVGGGGEATSASSASASLASASREDSRVWTKAEQKSMDFAVGLLASAARYKYIQV